MVIRAAVFALAICAALPVSALVIEGCPDGDGAGTPQAIGPYSPYAVAPGFMSYGAMEIGSEDLLEIVEYCPDRKQFVWRRGPFGSRDPLDMEADMLFDDMVNGSEGYTLNQMAEALRAIGETVEIRTVDYQSCACQMAAGADAGALE
jgi:hypothetical protein